jgi:hypothetical protein
MKVAFASLASLLLVTGASAQISRGPIIHPTTGTRYYRTTTDSWQVANTRAANLFGTLATIHDAATNEWIRVNVAGSGNSSDCFIGINDVATEGTFLWSNGEKPTYLNWRSGEPNNSGGTEDFGIMSPSTGQWNDIPPGFNRPAIIEVTGPIRVPLEYATIQAAINAAVNGQTILVAPGEYVGSFDYGFKRLVIRSESGAGVTTIRANNGVGIVMAGGQGPETVLEGFTIIPDASSPIRLLTVNDGQVVRGCRLRNPGNDAVYLGGTGVLSDCLFVGSQVAVLGISANGARTNATVQNCTFAGNVVAVGLGDTTTPNTVHVINSVTIGHTAPFSAGMGSNIFLRSNVVAEGPVGPTNLNADPRFVNAPGANGVYDLSDDYRLRTDSPCIDAANNALRKPISSIAAPADLAGTPRFLDDPARPDTGAGPGPVADCGAFEYAPPAPSDCPVDFNADGFLDFFDYDAFVQAYENGC